MQVVNQQRVVRQMDISSGRCLDDGSRAYSINILHMRDAIRPHSWSANLSIDIRSQGTFFASLATSLLSKRNSTGNLSELKREGRTSRKSTTWKETETCSPEKDRVRVPPFAASQTYKAAARLPPETKGTESAFPSVRAPITKSPVTVAPQA